MGLTAEAFAPNGSAVAFARSQGPLLVGSLTSGKVLARANVRGANIVRAAVDDDATFAAFVVEGSRDSVLRLLTIATGSVVDLTAVPEDLPTQLRFVPAAGLLLGATSRSELIAWPMRGGPLRWRVRIEEAAKSRFHVVQVGLAPSPEGRLVAVQRAGGRECHVVDLATGVVVRHHTLPPWQPGEAANAGTTAVWSADSRRLAWTTADARLAVAAIDDAESLRWSYGAMDLVAPNVARLGFADDGSALRSQDGAGASLRWPLARFLKQP